MVPGSARNWIVVNAVQQSSLNNKYDNSTLKKIKRPLAFAARRSSPRPRMVCALASGSSSYASTGWGLSTGNTALGDNALLNLTTGKDNTAIGFDALINTTTGSS